MQVVEGVVLQGSVPVCVVLTVLWLHGAVSALYILLVWSVYIIIIVDYYTNACADRLFSIIKKIRGIDEPRVSAGRRVSFPFLILMVILFDIVYYIKGKEIDTLFVPGDFDQLIACIRLPLVFNCTAQETSRLLSFFYNVGKLFVVRLNIPNLWLLLVGLCYLCLAAFVLIVVVNLLYACAMSTAVTFGFDNYYTSVDMNESLFEYQWRQDGNINSESDSYANKTVAGTITNYWRHSSWTYVIKNEEDITTTVGVNVYSMINNNRRRYQRFIGEDINISCSFVTLMERNEIGVYHTQFWKHNGRRLVPDKRHSEGRSRRYVNKYYHVHMYLIIRHITDADFGNYSCIDQYTQTGDVIDRCIGMKYEGQGVTIIRQEYGRIQVEKLPVLEHVIYVPPGNAIGTSRSFSYHTLASEDMSLSVEYTVNGEPLHDVCPSVPVLSSCSFLSAVFLMSHYRLLLIDLPFLYINHDTTFINTVMNNVNVMFCVCPDAYGWHKLSIFREIYSGTQVRRVVQFDHPLRLLVLPAPHISLLPFWNDVVLYGAIAKEIKDMHSERDIHTTTLKLIKAHEGTKLWITGIYHLAIFILYTYFISFIIVKSIVKYCKHITTPVICWYIPTENKAINFPNYDNELPSQYAAYISHCEHDYDWVTRKLVPYLEDICNIRVCLPDRDLRHGHNELQEMSDHMNASSKIIVVLSPAYLADYRCDQLQLHAMVLSSLYEKKRGPNDILLLKLKPCTVIRPLRWLLDVDTRNWSPLTNEREQLNNISNWVQRNNTRV